MALTDPLTGLANRNRFGSKLEEAIKMGRRFKLGIALLLLDLDHFKQINDTYGHPMGDALLQAVAAVLACEVREVDTVSRLGGDEFAVILEGVNEIEDAERLAQRYLEILRQPFDIMDHSFTIGTSLGIVHFPTDADSAVDMVRRADLALYQAKEEGRNTYRTFTLELEK